MVARPESSHVSPAPAATEASVCALPDWFVDFLNDRQTRKPSAHTMKAYHQDFVSIAALIADGDPATLTISEINKGSMRAAFATFARDHEPASIRRCWSTWNVLCTFLFTAELLAANPMALVGRPKLARSLPKALPRTAVGSLLQTVAKDVDSARRTDWVERDLAIILTALLAGLRAEELRQADVGDVRTVDSGAGVVHVKGKGGKERAVPVEADLLGVIEVYLDSRATRFPEAARHQGRSEGGGLSRWPARSPLFVGRDGKRITRGTVQSRIKRAFKLAGPDVQPVPGAMVHGLRHTYATELAMADVSVYTLMKLLGHDSMTTSQRYVTAAGAETRTAAAKNHLYTLLDDLARTEEQSFRAPRER